MSEPVARLILCEAAPNVRTMLGARFAGNGKIAVRKPEDIAHLVSFLVSEGAGFVSGQVIYVAGGPKA